MKLSNPGKTFQYYHNSKQLRKLKAEVTPKTTKKKRKRKNREVNEKNLKKPTYCYYSQFSGKQINAWTMEHQNIIYIGEWISIPFFMSFKAIILGRFPLFVFILDSPPPPLFWFSFFRDD
jgi:hypothetical protein